SPRSVCSTPTSTGEGAVSDVRSADDHQRWLGSPGPRRRLEVVMTTLFRRFRRLGAGLATAAALTLGLVAVALQFSSPASAQGSPSCADPVTSAPTGPATVSAASTPYGRVLVV